MIVTYTPKDGTRQEYLIKPLSTLSPDVERIEAVGGEVWDNWDEFRVALSRGKFRALRAVVWINLRLENPRILFQELVIGVDEVTYGPDAEEIEQARKIIAEDDELTDDQKTELLESLGKDDAEDPSPSNESDTSTESPEPASAA
jgi:hypothetical protein